MAQIRMTAEAVEGLPIDGKDTLYFDTLLKGFGVRVTPAGRKIFIAQRRLNGKPTRVTVGNYPVISVAKARDAARAHLKVMADGMDPRAAPAPLLTPDSVMFTDAVDRWLAEHVRPKLKSLTIRDYEKIAGTLKERFAIRTLDSINKGDARTLHAEMSETPRRANYFLSVLSAILSYSDRPALTAGIKRYRENQKERILSDQELDAVIAAINRLEANKKLSVFACQGIRFAILTGARPGEIEAIEWSFLDYDRKRVLLPDSKANRRRMIYCNLAAWSVITSTPKFGKYVFAGRVKDTGYSRLSNAWGDVRKEAGLVGIRLYDCRHSFASQAGMAGHNLPMIGALLGHTVPSTTQRYVHLVGAPADAAAQDVGDRISAALGKGVEDKGVSRINKKTGRST